METFSVIKNEFDFYVKSATKKRWITLSSIFFVVILFFAAYTKSLNPDFPTLFYVVFISLTMFGVLFWGQSIWAKTLSKFKTASYELNQKEIRFICDLIETKTFKLNEIAAIDTTWKGTVLVKGDIWAKIEYYRPKKSGNSLDSNSIIFIPRVTDNYDLLVEKIKTFANNG
jgi:hypothetical protein